MRIRGIYLHCLVIVAIGLSALEPGTSASESAPERFEGTGPVLSSRIVAKTSSETFTMKGIIQGVPGYSAGNLESAASAGSVAVGIFQSPKWSDVYWAMRNYGSSTSGEFVLFQNDVFQVRYGNYNTWKYVALNSSYPSLRQNFTVPSSSVGFTTNYTWLVVRVNSGTARFHLEIWNYGLISFGITSQSVEVSGPYDPWWVSLRMPSTRTLTNETYRIEAVWESGSGLEVLLIDNFRDADDRASGNAQLLNSTSSIYLNMSGLMMESVLTQPELDSYSTFFSAWQGSLRLRNLIIYLKGRNLPQSNVTASVNSTQFGKGLVPAIYLPFPFDQIGFTSTVRGSASFSGGTISFSSDLNKLNQSRVKYDRDHIPPFPRPFAYLSIKTDSVEKPWAYWEISAVDWSVRVQDAYGALHPLPATEVRQLESGLKVSYPIYVFPNAFPSYGFLNFTMALNYTIEASSNGPQFFTNYTVFPESLARWMISNPAVAFTAARGSNVTIKIDSIPNEWDIRSASVTAGPGGGIPVVLIQTGSILIRNILMGNMTSYSGSVILNMDAPNFLDTLTSYVQYRWKNSTTSFFLRGDAMRIDARASSTLPDYPPGKISLEVKGPSGSIFSQVFGQENENGVATGDIQLSLAGTHIVIATYRSLDGFRVGIFRGECGVLQVRSAIEKDRVLLSSARVSIELEPSDMGLVGSGTLALVSPNGTISGLSTDRINNKLVKTISFLQTDPSVIGNWSVIPSIVFPNGLSRDLSPLRFRVLDDIPPNITNVFQLPKETTFLDPVNVTIVVDDKGTGVNSVWISYSIGDSSTRNNITAVRLRQGIYSATIPRQSPFTRVSYWVCADDKAKNSSELGPYSYEVLIPIWMWAVAAAILILLGIGILIQYRQEARKSEPGAPPAPIQPLGT